MAPTVKTARTASTAPTVSTAKTAKTPRSRPLFPSSPRHPKRARSRPRRSSASARRSTTPRSRAASTAVPTCRARALSSSPTSVPARTQFSVQASAVGAPSADPAEFDWVVERPNILFILADDLGYSDIHALGGEIDTPNLDALVANGRILTNHHVGTVSAITRSMLVSGTDHHLVGEGTMGPPADERKGLPGYEGYLNDSSLSLAELLKDAGYHTYIAGKWHLGNAIVGTTAPGKTPDQWGFERSYALLGGAGSNHFFHEPAGSKNYTRDGAYVQPGQQGQPGGYSTELYTNQLIEFIDSNHGDGKPFFAYAAYTSPHWPLAVPEPWLSKYKGKYDQGYDAIRAARIARLQSRGLVPLFVHALEARARDAHVLAGERQPTAPRPRSTRAPCTTRPTATSTTAPASSTRAGAA